MLSPLEDLLTRAQGRLGQDAQVDFGVGGAFGELAALLSGRNGFTVFGSAVQVYRAGTPGAGPELGEWNTGELWKDTFGGLADDVFCFGQDVLGTQFGILGEQVVLFDPETADVEVIGKSLQDWAAWLLADPQTNATVGLTVDWERTHGRLSPDQRLVPLRFLALGGELELDNLVVKEAAEAMRVRGPIAQQLHDLPDGAEIDLNVE
ncbi:SMI1/KNR4 family protein [Actinosynnema sp. NPDC004786]